VKILVTGAGGFIGSHLTEKLVNIGHDVTAFTHYNSRNSWGWLDESPIKNEINIISGDIRDFDSVKAATAGVDTVFHLAALIGIPYSYVSPLAYVKTNMEGTYNVMQAARECNVSRVVHTSTSEVYGSAQRVPIDEDHPINPQSPYSATKASADYLALSYYTSFDIPVTVVRPFNTYGPRQSARAIIPTIISQILSGFKTIKLGNLTPTRDLNFVEDTANGFITVGLHEKSVGKTLNLGTGKEISIGDLAKKIISLTGKEVEVIQDTSRLRPSKSEVERLLSDPSQAMELTGWRPENTLSEGLQKTIEWIQANLSEFKPEIYNV
jgi:NAD dependent epimerase/dehydratase